MLIKCRTQIFFLGFTAVTVYRNTHL